MSDRLGHYALMGRSMSLEEKLLECTHLDHVEEFIWARQMADKPFTREEWSLVLARQRQLGGGR